MLSCLYLIGEVEKLIDLRNRARLEKDWAAADKIRDKLDDMGIILDDTADGTLWRKK